MNLQSWEEIHRIIDQYLEPPDEEGEEEEENYGSEWWRKEP